MLGAQAFSVVCLFLWGFIITYPLMWIVNQIITIRLDPQDEILGCDIVEHFIGDEKEKALTIFDGVRISNVRLDHPQVSLNLQPLSNYANASYKEFDTVPHRRNIHIGYHRNEDDLDQQTTAKI